MLIPQNLLFTDHHIYAIDEMPAIWSREPKNDIDSVNPTSR
jgi:hypothetical protein